MTDARQAQVGDSIRLRGVDGQIVEVSRYTGAGLNWSVWRIALCRHQQPRQPEHRWLLRMQGRMYEAEISYRQHDGEPVQVAAGGHRLARHGEAQREVSTASQRDFGPCEFAYYVGDDGGVTIHITDRAGLHVLTGTPIEPALVELFPA